MKSWIIVEKMVAPEKPTANLKMEQIWASVGSSTFIFKKYASLQIFMKIRIEKKCEISEV